MAANAGEQMLASYRYEEMEKLLAKHGFAVKEHLLPKEITKKYFSAYNRANPEHRMQAGENVNYCAAIGLIK